MCSFLLRQQSLDLCGLYICLNISIYFFVHVSLLLPKQSQNMPVRADGAEVLFLDWRALGFLAVGAKWAPPSPVLIVTDQLKWLENLV